MPPVTDNIAASESLSHYSDQVDVGERLTVFTDILYLSASDTATVSDAVAVGPDVPSINKSESVSVSESVALDIPLNIATSDTTFFGLIQFSIVIVTPLVDLNVTVTAGIQQTGGVRVV